MPALNRGRFLAALRAPDPAIRLWLVCGRDEGEVEGLVAAARAALAAAAQTVELAPSLLAEDPGQLADRAAAIPLFGGRELLFVRAHVHPRPETLLPAIEALLEAPAAGNPCLVHAGNLARTSKLRVLAEGHPLAHAVFVHPPEGADAGNLAGGMARAAGILLDRDMAERLWAAAGANSRVVAREVEKLALYLDAAPDRPRRASNEALDALLPGETGAAFSTLGQAVLARDAAATAAQLAGLGGASAIPALRTIAHQLLQGRGAGRWRPHEAMQAIDALIDAEADVKAPGSAGDRIGWAAILGLAVPPLGGRPPRA